MSAPPDAGAEPKEVPAPQEGTGTQERRQTSDINDSSGTGEISFGAMLLGVPDYDGGDC